MRAAIYNPYWDTLGGGERYTATFAKLLYSEGYAVDIQWKDISLPKQLNERFGLELDNVRIVSDIKKGDGYDICFWVSDGSIPILHARKNLLHFQVPFKDVSGSSLLNKMKLYRVNKVICNSAFTKNIIDKEYGVDSIVIYPPVDTENIKPKKKENIILAVGRFSQLKQAKRHDLLIEAFKKMLSNNISGWRLILAGGVEVGAGDGYEKIRRSIEGYPIEIIESPSYKRLCSLYSRSKIFWTASGYGENENKNPERVEHFGITLVEAMAGGCLVFAFNAGGHKEILKNNVNGYLWEKQTDLINKTKSVIKDQKSYFKVCENATRDSIKYGYHNFSESVSRII